MRVSGLLCGFTVSAAIHAVGFGLLLWLAFELADEPARFPGRRVGVQFSLDVRPGPPPAKVRGSKPQLGVNTQQSDKLKTKVALDKVDRKPAAPAQQRQAKEERKARTENAPESKVAEVKRADQPKKQAKAEVPATFLVAQPLNHVKPLDANSKSLKRPKPPDLKAQVSAPAPKALQDAGQAEPLRPAKKPVLSAQGASQASLISTVLSSAATSKTSYEPSQEVVLIERLATMAAEQVVPPTDDTGLHAVSLRPDLPTHRGKPGAKGAQVLGTDESMPNFYNNTPPIYPPSAVRQHLEGTVMLRLHVAKTGRVTDVEIVHSSGHAILDDAAVEAISTWTGAPRTRFGQAIASVEQLPVVFTLR